jgi:ATP-binding cassette subfamily B protein RaxB
VPAGSLPVGMLVAFLSYKDQFSQRIATFLDTLVRMSMLTLHGERIADIALSEPEEAMDTSPALVAAESTPLPRAKAALSARAISFRYGDNEPHVIANFNRR